MADSPNTIPVTEISRQIVEAEIDMLIDLLDMFDPDPDFEDSTDAEVDTADEEPWLGAPERFNFTSFTNWEEWEPRISGDREEECEDEGAQVDEEYDFGWTDIEARDGSARYLNGDAAEPDLGSINFINQIHWSSGRTDDSEEQCDDEGDTSGDLEPPGEQAPCYSGFCSPITTMIGPRT